MFRFDPLGPCRAGLGDVGRATRPAPSSRYLIKGTLRDGWKGCAHSKVLIPQIIWCWVCLRRTKTHLRLIRTYCNVYHIQVESIQGEICMVFSRGVLLQLLRLQPPDIFHEVLGTQIIRDAPQTIPSIGWPIPVQWHSIELLHLKWFLLWEVGPLVASCSMFLNSVPMSLLGTQIKKKGRRRQLSAIKDIFKSSQRTSDWTPS